MSEELDLRLLAQRIIWLEQDVEKFKRALSRFKIQKRDGTKIPLEEYLSEKN
jgi:hypothetical protein